VLRGVSPATTSISASAAEALSRRGP